jgi:hypothetical protein
LWSNASKTAAGFLKPFAYHGSPQQQVRGGVVNNEGHSIPEQGNLIRPGLAHQRPGQQGFTTEDILWALGIWSVIICLSPVIVFYMLMVA